MSRVLPSNGSESLSLRRKLRTPVNCLSTYDFLWKENEDQGHGRSEMCFRSFSRIIIMIRHK